MSTGKYTAQRPECVENTFFLNKKNGYKQLIINQLQTTDYQSVKKKAERSGAISKKGLPFQGLKCISSI